jgi:hypothetical protein
LLRRIHLVKFAYIKKVKILKLKTIFFLALIVNVGFANGQKMPNVHGKFVGTLELKPVGDGVHMTVVETYLYTDPLGHMLQANPGFSTDGASIPRALWAPVMNG